METERPIRHLGRCPDDLRVLLRDFGRLRFAARQKVKVEHAANDIIFERGGVISAAVTDLDVHARGTEEEDGVRAALGAMLKVNWMGTIQVRSSRDAIRVACPHRERRVAEAERFRVLAETIDIRRGRQRRLQAEVLRFEDKRVFRGREEPLARARTRYVERERRRGVRESDLRVVRARARICEGPWENGFGDLVALI